MKRAFDKTFNALRKRLSIINRLEQTIDLTIPTLEFIGHLYILAALSLCETEEFSKSLCLDIIFIAHPPTLIIYSALFFSTSNYMSIVCNCGIAFSMSHAWHILFLFYLCGFCKQKKNGTNDSTRSYFLHAVWPCDIDAHAWEKKKGKKKLWTLLSCKQAVYSFILTLEFKNKPFF